jgi:hypothetical protein
MPTVLSLILAFAIVFGFLVACTSGLKATPTRELSSTPDVAAIEAVLVRKILATLTAGAPMKALMRLRSGRISPRL